MTDIEHVTDAAEHRQLERTDDSPSGKSMTEMVLDAIERAEGPLTLDEISDLTNLTKDQIRNVVARLKARGQLVSAGRGTYRLRSERAVGSLYEYVGRAGGKDVVRSLETNDLFLIEPLEV